MANQYNFIFRQLIQNDHDFVGMVAYTLYKKQKIEWIEQFQADNGGREPEEAELAQFYRISNMPSQLKAYREQAIDLLDQFLDYALSDKVEEIRLSIQQDALVQAQTTHHAKVMSVVDKPLHKVVWENLLIGGISSLMTLAATGLIWVAAKGPENLIRDAIQNVMHPPSAEASATAAQPQPAPQNQAAR